MKFQDLTTRLARLSRRLLLRILLSGIPLLAGCMVALALVTFFLDFSLDLPTPVRAVLLFLSLGSLALVAWKLLVNPLLHKPSLDRLALLVEQHDPSLNECLISALQLERDLREGRAVESPAMIRAFIQETASKLARYPFARAAPLGSCVRPLLLGSCALAAAVLLCVRFPEQSHLWFQRQCLLKNVSWPRATTLRISIPEISRFAPERTRNGAGQLTRVILHVPQRTPLQVQVTALGVVPQEVELVTAPLAAPRFTQPISMGRPQGREFFQHIFPPLNSSLILFARGGDDDDGLPVYEIRVAKAPRVTRFWADYSFPAYTGLPEKTLPDSNISAPEGTRVSMHFKANMPLKAFILEFESGSRIKLQADAAGTISHTFPVAQNDFYTYRIKGQNGVQAPEAARYVITSQADQAPRIKVRLPDTADLSLTPDALLPLLGAATDDYGITKVGYRYGTDPSTLSDGSHDFAGAELLNPLGKRQVRFFHLLPVASLLHRPGSPEGPPPKGEDKVSPREGDRLYLGFLGVDNRQTGSKPEPHRTFADFAYRILILSPEDLERELTQRQVQLKNWVMRISELEHNRIQDAQELLAQLKGKKKGPPEIRKRLQELQQGQTRVFNDLANTDRIFERIFHAFLWNRLEKKDSLTTRLIDVFSGLYKKTPDAGPTAIRKAAVEAVRPLIDESTTMGVLTLILDIFQKAAHEHAPAARKLLARAALVTSQEEQRDLMESSLVQMRLLDQDLLQLVDKLQAWEDFFGMLQALQDTLDVQEGIQTKIKKLTKK